MDFMDPYKKRAHRRRLIIGYGLIGALIVIVSYIILNAVYGYGIDRKTGQIIQNGLVIINAHPETADIVVNGQNRGTTNNRLLLPEGAYDIELKRDGYQSWKRHVNVEGGSIEQLVYPVLFPSKLVTKSIQSYDGVPSMVSTSPDRHWLVLQRPGSATSFQMVDLSSDTNPVTALELPPTLVTDTDGTDTYEEVEWSTDNTHVLLKHVYPEGVEFIVLNRENPAASLNLNRLFTTRPFTTVNLRDKKFDQYYLYYAPNGQLFTADVRNPNPVLLVNNVLSFKAYKADVLLYTTNPGTSNVVVEVHTRQGAKDSLLRTLPVGPRYLLDIAEFAGQVYLVSGSPVDGRVYVYKNPFDDLNRTPARTPQPIRVMVSVGAQFVSFSANTRFIAVQNGSFFVVYDAETGRQSRYNTKLPLLDGQKATWMDGHRLTLMSGGVVQVFDFDGTNIQSLSPGLVTFPAFFDRDYKALLTLASDPAASAKTILSRTELRAAP